jgi:excisionase family DNA binding protein
MIEVTSPTPPDDRRSLLTVEQAATLANVSPRMIRRVIADRRLAFHKIGKHVRIAERDLVDFIDRGRVEPSRK